MINALKLLISLIIFSQISSAQVSYSWEHPTFLTNEEQGAVKRKMDVNSNIYSIGRFNDSISIGDTVLYTSLEQGIFVSKYDINHEFIWAKLIAESNLKDSGFQPINIIAGFRLRLDEMGNIYPLLYYTDETLINGVLYTVDQTMVSPRDNALIKLNGNGDFQDINHFKGSCSPTLTDVLIDGAIYYHLSFTKFNTEVLDSCSCVINGDTTIYSTNNKAIFGKINTSGGAPEWERIVKLPSGNGNVSLFRIAKTASNIYVTGNVNNSLSIQYDSDTLLIPSDISSLVYLMKLDLNGNKIWWETVSIGNTNSNISPWNLIVNTEDDILLVTGAISPSSQQQIQFSNSSSLIGSDGTKASNVLINYSGTGAVKWKDIHCSNDYHSPIKRVDVNSDNKIFTWGNHSYQLIVGQDTILLDSDSKQNYILEYSLNGGKLIVNQINSPNNVGAKDMFVDQFDDIHVIGKHSGDLMEFGPIEIPNPPLVREYFFAKLSNSPLSVFSEEEVDELIIFPNPSSGQFFLKLKNAKIREVEVFNILGEKMNIQSFYNGSNEINLVDLVKGMYIIKVTSTTGTYSQRKVLIE